MMTPLMVSRNSHIMVTKGRDVYQVNPESDFQGKIILTFQILNQKWKMSLI